MRVTHLTAAVLVSLLLPTLAVAVGPSPAKRASAIIARQGYCPASAVTVYRSPSHKVGAARVKLMNGQVIHALVNLRSNSIIAEKDLTARANQLTALKAHSRGWTRGYSVENDPDGMVPAMTAHGNVRRAVVNYDTGASAFSIVTFTPQGRVKHVNVPRMPATE